jgi:hypothetical protein
MRGLLILSVCSLLPGTLLAQEKPAKELVLFDFEDPAEVKAFAPLQLPKGKEPAPQFTQAATHATSGKHSLKITFDGGKWPTIITTKVPDNWDDYQSFHADVTVSTDCVIGFMVMQEGSSRASGWDGGVSRWTKTAILRPGKHAIAENLHPNGWSAVKTKLENGKVLGKVVSLEIFLYSPAKGETIYVDNIRLSTAKLKPAPVEKPLFQVLGTDWKVTGVQELGKKLAKEWTKPVEKTVAQVEAEFQAQFTEFKKKHPKAVLAIFRDGQKGYDPAQPDKVFAGWKDAYWSSHGPDGLTEDRATNYGKHASQEMFMRHRSPLMRVDLASIPKGSEILAAKLIIVRASGEYGKDNHPFQPNMWVAEACNRPWEETEVNAYEFARGKFWHAIGGMQWDGPNPDFLPIYLAYGPGGGKVNTWDFTHAVRFWTSAPHPNHGFMLHGDSRDWMNRAWFREAPKVEDRPALLVIYQPPAS